MIRRARGRGGDERELVAELARVLDDADHGAATAVERQRRADLEPQQLSDTVGDGDLTVGRRIAAPADREQLAAVRAVRVL